MSTADHVLTIEQAAAQLGTNPTRLAARLGSTPPARRRRPAAHDVPNRRRSSFNEDRWIDDDGAWTDGRDLVPPSAAAAATWRTAIAARRRPHRARRGA